MHIEEGMKRGEEENRKRKGGSQNVNSGKR